MTQLHTIHHGLGIVRPTNDVDIVLHIETQRGVPNKVAAALEGLGYRFQPSIDERNNTAHRFVRGTSTVDLVTGVGNEDQVDVLIADHPAPRVIEKLRGQAMIRIEGGTQALRRTVNARLEIAPGTVATISVPRPFGALILKAAAYNTDSRERERHLFDAAALLTCIDDPFAERIEFTGSDRRIGRFLGIVGALAAFSREFVEAEHRSPADARSEREGRDVAVAKRPLGRLRRSRSWVVAG